MRESSVTFFSAGTPQLQLEGRLHFPTGGQSWPGVVVCHPHSLHGGSMQTTLVVAIARALAERGLVALRFNFRGVGRSEGAYGEGVGELDDAAGAFDFLEAQPGVDGSRLYLVGYSFGAWVGLRYAAGDTRVRACAAVGLPLHYLPLDFIETDARPKLFVTGEHDDLCPPAQLEDWVARLPQPKEMHVILGADHFLLGRHDEVAEMIAEFLAQEATALTRQGQSLSARNSSGVTT